MKSFRSISAHIVYTNTGDPIPYGVVTVAGDGTVISVEAQKEGHEGYNTEFFNGIIVPGFVNAHCHLELSYLKSVFEANCGMAGFLRQMSEKRKINIEKADDYCAIYDSKMYRDGISLCADIVNSNITSEIKKRSRIHYSNFIEIFGLRPDDAEFIIGNAEKLKTEFGDSHLNPHALYSLSDKLFEFLKRTSVKGSITSIHYKESGDEIEYLKENKGKLADVLNEIESIKPDFLRAGINGILEELFMSDQKILFVHNTFSDREDSEFIEKKFPFSSIVICPSSNLFITGKLPDISVFSTDRICIGTDSLASNSDISMLHEMKLIQDTYPELEFCEVLKWATYNGARALGREDTFGAISPGMKPGIVLIDKFDFQKKKIKTETISRRLV